MILLRGLPLEHFIVCNRCPNLMCEDPAEANRTTRRLTTLGTPASSLRAVGKATFIGLW